MKANEFVKKFGPDEATRIVKASQYIGIDKSVVDLDDLKRLVESHEIVESHGGLEKAKEYLSKKHILAWSALDGQLSQAVKDVESCQ